MGKSSRKKGNQNKEKAKAKANSRKKMQPNALGQFWASRSPVFRFVAGFALIMIVFYAFFSTEVFKTYIFTPVVKLNAFIGSIILSLLGQGTSNFGTSIGSDVFSISIAAGCDGIEPIMLYVAAVLAFPFAWGPKIKGALVGAVFLFLLNFVRIVSLFLTGVYLPSLFDIMHVDVWQAIFIVVAVICWLVWMQWAIKNHGTPFPPHQNDSASGTNLNVAPFTHDN